MDNKIKEHFKRHNKSEVFQTSDGFLFHKDFDARAHAGSLKDKTVKRFERGSEEVAKAEPDTAGQTTESDSAKKAIEQPNAPKATKTSAANKKTTAKAAKGAKASKEDSVNNTNPDAAGESDNA